MGFMLIKKCTTAFYSSLISHEHVAFALNLFRNEQFQMHIFQLKYRILI